MLYIRGNAFIYFIFFIQNIKKLEIKIWILRNTNANVAFCFCFCDWKFFILSTIECRCVYVLWHCDIFHGQCWLSTSDAESANVFGSVRDLRDSLCKNRGWKMSMIGRKFSDLCVKKLVKNSDSINTRRTFLLNFTS